MFWNTYMFVAFDPHSCSKPGRTISKGLSCAEFRFLRLNINLFEVWWVLNHHKCTHCFFISIHLCVLIYFYYLAVLPWFCLEIYAEIRFGKRMQMVIVAVSDSVWLFWVFKPPPMFYIWKANVVYVLSCGTPMFSFFSFNLASGHRKLGTSLKVPPMSLSDKKRLADVEIKKRRLIFQTRGKLWLTCS